ncbi:sensor histidine kinase [Actinomadura logoneensis]|uniref:histidine kinase n=1 Tax=Actinomadura logoneensis TaxID=2293572 RepID=A0A372JK56_9ACTN|nr:HAMP domain-containing sensor histidine kinase [Actinomadura logoneensis]RFU40401.1 sensor histidine kinase [Actinomadura logoneensis]
MRDGAIAPAEGAPRRRGVRPPRPRSIRARVTWAASLGTGLLLVLLVAAAGFLLQWVARSRVHDDAAMAARRVAVTATSHRLADPVPPEGRSVAIQVVDARTDRVLAASAGLAGAPMTTRRPVARDTRVDVRICGDRRVGEGCAVVVGYEVISVYGDVMVYAAVPEPWFIGSPAAELALGALCAAVLALVAAGVWRAVGRALRPVRRIEQGLAEITASDLSRRVPVPDSGDEIAGLAATVNATLNRLERAVVQQRQFVADASHELRTPLTGLRARLELALDDPADPELMDTVRGALRDADRLHRIVDDLLALARLDSGVEPGRELMDLGGLVRAEDGRHVSRVPVVMDVEPDVMVLGNRLQLGRALLNLLANADRHAVSEVSVEVRAADGRALLTVADDGPGIPPDERERIFDRFTRLDSARSRDAGGSGLGLPIAREIAVRHGGTLTVEPVSGRGAAFVMSLPLADTG